MIFHDHPLVEYPLYVKKNENRFCLGIAGTEKETADEEKNKEKEEKDEKMDTSEDKVKLLYSILIGSTKLDDFGPF